MLLSAALVGCDDDGSGEAGNPIDGTDGTDEGSEGSEGGGSHFASGFEGDWSGTYQDNDFSQFAGGVSSTIEVDEANQALTFTLDFDGPILAQNDPPEETFTGSYDETSFTVSTQSVVFGPVTLTFDIDGDIDGVGAPPGFESIVFAGSGTPTAITLGYTLHDGGGVASTGSLTLARK
ncbi:hypothetical protein [Enhygromyxa salina]|uniref:Uncharacterized protein n=1 Tax=Enhygromyxa salina TaxID=215803 RepID=A0A2S9YVI0_9BACT|nr:hypothetical protein [Enhygromyxa salina]PRQ09111.1 hypothetical protein ENSA7_11010 [Enhygromyxa salina]